MIRISRYFSNWFTPLRKLQRNRRIGFIHSTHAREIYPARVRVSRRKTKRGLHHRGKKDFPAESFKLRPEIFPNRIYL